MHLQKIQAELVRIFEENMDVLEELLRSPKVGPMVKLRVLEFITSRVPGLGPIKTSVTHTLTAEMTPREILQMRNRLLKEKQELVSSLKLIGSHED